MKPFQKQHQFVFVHFLNQQLLYIDVRAQTVEKLAENFPVKIEKDWHKAIDQAFLHEGVVFVTGSLYFLAQVRPYILEHQKNK